jgi:nucleoside-diphosphate-sugar epimerase
MADTKKILVTGAAGFIGSSICDQLLQMHCQVIGIDSLTDYYDTRLKHTNLQSLVSHPDFTFIEKSILDINWPVILDGVDTVYHQAAQAGVRASWGQSFSCYIEWNVLSTQHMLEALRGRGIRMVYASSSSIYGETTLLPMMEEHRPQPMSPYGVSKLAAEHLCILYWRNFKVPTVSLRYFTVYGPRQRPDMAFHRFIRSGLTGEPITLYGDGEQTRDFTYISDAVHANLLAAERGRPGEVYNIGGGSRITVNGALEKLEKILDRPLHIKRMARQKGDVTHTYADTSRARQDLEFIPDIKLDEGLAKEVEWFMVNRAILL